MHTHHLLRIVLLSSILSLLTIALMTPVASAHTVTSTQQVTTATYHAPDIPNVNIVRENGRSEFSPREVRCKARGLGPDKTCFTITNMTDKDQQVIYKGMVILTIPPGRIGNFSVSNAGIGLIRLHANSQAILTLIAS